MAACGGCGATMSPAEHWCHACGGAVPCGPLIDLPRIEDREVAPSHHATVAPRDPTPARRGWPVFTGVTLSVALIATVVMLANAGDGAPRSSPTTSPRADRAATASTAAPTADSSPTTAVAPPVAPPFGQPLPYTVVVVDDEGKAHLFDLATGSADERTLAVGVLDGERITEVLGGPVGPLALRSNQSRYHLVDLDDPWPRQISGRAALTHDDQTGWSWFGDCPALPCDGATRVRGYGPPGYDLVDIDLPAPTTKVDASAGYLFAAAAGSIFRFDREGGEPSVVASGALLDARDTTVVVRSCAIDVRCPAYVVDTAGQTGTVRVDAFGDDVQLSPDGTTLAAGARAPLLASRLQLFDVATGAPLDVDPDALRYVIVPFAWSPDGAWLFATTTERTLVGIRVADGVAFRAPLPGALDHAIVGLVVRSTPVGV